MDTVPLEGDLDMMCQDNQQIPLSNSLPGQDITLQQPPIPVEPTGQLVNVTADMCVLTTEKNNTNMQCELVQHTDEDMVNSDDATTSQESTDPMDIEIEKEKSIKSQKDQPGNTKDSFSVGFPPVILEYVPTTEQFNNTGSLRSRGGVEIYSDRENKDSIQETCDTNTLNLRVNHSASCGENVGPEEVRRCRDSKHKPLPSASPKPVSMFTRPVSQNEEDGKEDDLNSCHTSNNMGMCLNSVKPTLDSTKSGLFLYMDMHGHASKKGEYMNISCVLHFIYSRNLINF